MKHYRMTYRFYGETNHRTRDYTASEVKYAVRAVYELMDGDRCASFVLFNDETGVTVLAGNRVMSSTYWRVEE